MNHFKFVHILQSRGPIQTKVTIHKLRGTVSLVEQDTIEFPEIKKKNQLHFMQIFSAETITIFKIYILFFVPEKHEKLTSKVAHNQRLFSIYF